MSVDIGELWVLPAEYEVFVSSEVGVSRSLSSDFKTSAASSDFLCMPSSQGATDSSSLADLMIVSGLLPNRVLALENSDPKIYTQIDTQQMNGMRISRIEQNSPFSL
uniref:Uncharacterized protein n=1 Tax=Glossina pallidipes TaxID=7398 RepID=A0A1A9ZWY7_GLOPL